METICLPLHVSRGDGNVWHHRVVLIPNPVHRCLTRALAATTWKTGREKVRRRRWLSDLFQGMDSWSDWDEDPIREYLKSMTDRAHHANALANARIHGRPRPANTALQKRLSKLIEEIPPVSVDKHNITSQSSAKDKWHVVAKLVTQYIGEIRILWPESATWTLCKVDHWDYLSDMWLVR